METTYYTTPYSSGDLAAFWAFYTVLVPFVLFFAAVAYVVTSIFLGKIFKKAGVESWIAWVPFYNYWKLLEIGGKPGWWVLIGFIPLVGLVTTIMMIIAMYNIGKKLGKEDAFVLLGIFLWPVWLIWLGSDSSTWDDSKGDPRLDTPTVAPATVAPAAPTPDTSATPTPDSSTPENTTPPPAPPTI